MDPNKSRLSLKKYDYKLAESDHQKKWEEEQIYAYQALSDKKKFVIDTPPPTVSGSLHIGHIFSYTQTDIIARFKRMNGYNVFYPMGFDDNGLPTEKRIQNLYQIKCDPKKDYDSSLDLSFYQKKEATDSSKTKHSNLNTTKTSTKNQGSSRQEYRSVSRQNFLEACHYQVLEDEKKYKKLWNHISLSVDWNQSYQTIGPKAQALSQYSFLDLYHKKAVENRLSPVLWDTQFQTAVAQADVEDREKNTFYNDILFQVEQGGEFVISTTRPELLPACVAVAAHPDDERYKKWFGSKAITPLFERRVPILASTHADPKKGTGILMICTFGDMEDVHFCQKQKLETLQIIDEHGFLAELDFAKAPFKSKTPSTAQSYYSHLKGLRVQQARKKIVSILKEKGLLKGEPKASRHHVKFYEKGDFPLEILPKRQWYIKILDHKEAFLKLADQVQWHPSPIKNRYEQWVEGLNQDWCISRQRAYGVPFPVWYALDKKGQNNYDSFLLPQKIKKAIDPLKQAPEGFKEEQREQAQGFTADLNVMDTWATSSLTPFINSDWILNPKKHQGLFPADLRTQGHEIIRTWAFYTLVKSYFHQKTIPWKHIAISGWVMSPQKKKMSKSKGNSLNPKNLLETYSADAIRYWAAKASLGQDTVYDENLFKIGKRLSTKIFSSSRFVQLQFQDQETQAQETQAQETQEQNQQKEKPQNNNQMGSGYESCFNKITQPIDQAWILSLLETQKEAMTFLEDYQHHKALNLIEKQFWIFCDDYLELIKSRAYKLRESKEGISALHSLDLSLALFLKLFAPFLPYVTEEIWQFCYRAEAKSIHQSLYLTKEELEKSLSRLKENGLSLKSNFYQDKVEKFKEKQNQAGENVEDSVKEKWKELNLSFILDTAFSILREVRKSKSSLGKSLATPINKIELNLNLKQRLSLFFYEQDLLKACLIQPESFAIKVKESGLFISQIKLEDKV